MEITSLSRLFALLEGKRFRVDRRRSWLLFRGQREDKPLLPRLARETIDQTRVGDIEKDLLYLFKRKALPFIEYELQDDWEWLAVAQHHSLPTRLLDWTFNPLAALWFAVREPAVANARGVCARGGGRVLDDGWVTRTARVIRVIRYSEEPVVVCY